MSDADNVSESRIKASLEKSRGLHTRLAPSSPFSNIKDGIDEISTSPRAASKRSLDLSKADPVNPIYPIRYTIAIGAPQSRSGGPFLWLPQPAYVNLVSLIHAQNGPLTLDP